jgi:ATP-dependent Clp protease ATP-binding subunit ClpC
MTSNIGTQDIKSFGKGIGFSQAEADGDMNYQSMKSTVEDALKNVFNPEFLNRIDDVIVFHPLDKENIFEIIDIMSEDLFDRAEELGLELEFDEHAKEFLTDKGFDPKYGARPLRRALQKYVEDPMAEDILHDRIGEGDVVNITHEGDEEELAFEVVHRDEASDDAETDEPETEIDAEADEEPPENGAADDEAEAASTAAEGEEK